MAAAQRALKEVSNAINSIIIVPTRNCHSSKSSLSLGCYICWFSICFAQSWSLLMRQLIWKGALFDPWFGESSLSLKTWNSDEFHSLGGHLQLLFLYFLQQHGSVYWKKGSMQILKNASAELPLHQSLQVNMHKRALKGDLRCPFSDPYTLLFSLQTFPLFGRVASCCSIKWNVLVIPSAPGLLTFLLFPSDSTSCFKSLQLPMGIPESFCVRVAACLFF